MIGGVRYLQLRGVLSPGLAEAPSGSIDRALGPEVAQDLENLAGIARTITPAVANVAPNVIRGAATGFLVGGPAGAAAGGIAAGLAGHAPSGARPPIANPAALQLLLTLLRPEVVDALLAMALGRSGAHGVEIAGQAVPVAAVSNLIQSLAEAASASHHASRVHTGIPRYLSEARRSGRDIAAPEVRTGALLELIHDAWEDDRVTCEAHDEVDVDDLYPGGLDR